MSPWDRLCWQGGELEQIGCAIRALPLEMFVRTNGRQPSKLCGLAGTGSQVRIVTTSLNGSVVQGAEGGDSSFANVSTPPDLGGGRVPHDGLGEGAHQQE
eukprot:5550952-Amphidinium_carterae.2